MKWIVRRHGHPRNKPNDTRPWCAELRRGLAEWKHFETWEEARDYANYKAVTPRILK